MEPIGVRPLAPPLPPARGPWSERARDVLLGRGPGGAPLDLPDDPLGDDDLQLALYLCYELHYRGLEGVPEEAEWDPAVLSLRRQIEDPFERALRTAVPRPASRDPRETLLDIAGAADRHPLAEHIEREATLEQALEFLIHRSAYQLKEADPHSWVIPRLEGAAKTGVMDVQYDEYGSGDPRWIHAELFRTTMERAGLDGRYGAYVEDLPGVTLATVNVISLFGLHRRWRGAALGHLAVFEMTSPLANRSYAAGMRRLGLDADAVRFFDEHVEADAVHQVLALDAAIALGHADPSLVPDVIFGAGALQLVEERWARSVLDAWRSGAPSLRPRAATPVR
jgi:hypothetical protein